MPEQPAPARDFPQLRVPCPRCAADADAGRLCMSHDGTRPMRHTIHRDRRAAWADTPPANPPAAS